MDILYAYYMDLDRDQRSQIFTNTLSALEENQEDKEHES
ncbi:Sialic acid utilization regulator, RpiR family [Streptococcus gordonii]|uniref:Sialic acid utilization regulator, RpiR family n=1 Tax=Streptococcus gordonii TaxID=1302 RepID=A0A139N356_STRGN|nr:Sialic acid utilization regulator, RpiR family [Streptococcus gordonii]